MIDSLSNYTLQVLAQIVLEHPLTPGEDDANFSHFPEEVSAIRSSLIDEIIRRGIKPDWLVFPLVAAALELRTLPPQMPEEKARAKAQAQALLETALAEVEPSVTRTREAQPTKYDPHLRSLRLPT